MTDPEYLAFIEKRIPELQREGKVHPEDPPGTDLYTQIKHARENADAPRPYPGVLARRQADKEWAERRKG
jgi:hypothetical protein